MNAGEISVLESFPCIIGIWINAAHSNKQISDRVGVYQVPGRNKTTYR